MMLLLTILSVLAVWAFLTVLILGLLVIFKTLDGIRGHLQRIAWGVRAIAQETAPLGVRAEALSQTLAATGSGFAAAADRLEIVAAGLKAAAPAFRRR
jgi:hypothetical protein